MLNPRNNSPCGCQISPVFAVASIIWSPYSQPYQTKIAFSTIRKTSVSRTVDMFGPFCPSQPYHIGQIRLLLRHPFRLSGTSARFPLVLPLLARHPSRMSRSPSAQHAPPQIASQGRLSMCRATRFVLAINTNSSICDSLPPLARSAVRMDKHTTPPPDELIATFLWQPAPFAPVPVVLPRVESNLTRYRYRYIYYKVHIVHNKTPAIIPAGVVSFSRRPVSIQSVSFSLQTSRDCPGECWVQW